MQKQLRAKKLLYQISSLYNIILFHQRLEYFPNFDNDSPNSLTRVHDPFN